MTRRRGEATDDLCGPEFFARHTVAELKEWSEASLADAGRITHPLRYDPARDAYRPVSWDEAAAVVATELNRVRDPDEVEFFSSGKTSNEAGFLYQLFARRLGTNNLPICLNRATSIVLKQSIGVEGATCRLKDFDLADAIFVFGQNPDVAPRRLAERLRAASARGAAIVSFDPLAHDGGGCDARSRQTFQLRVGGDAAAVTGMIKALLEAEAAARSAGRPGLVDRDFVERHTLGLDELARSVAAAGWGELERISGLSQAEMERAAGIYARSKRVILLYGMGVIQHRDGAANVGQIVNLALIRGNVGKPGAGVCPVAGHSFVTSVGVVPSPSIDLVQRIEARYGFRPPQTPGHDLVHALEAMIDRKARICIALGGNMARSSPDWEKVHSALGDMDLTVHVSTRLNHSHLTHGREALILPCLERDEANRSGGELQATTSEDFLSEVRAVVGAREPAFPLLKSEVEIICLLAAATFRPGSGPDWLGLSRSHAAIRAEIEALFPAFRNYNARIDRFGALRLGSPARRRVWNTPSGKAAFEPLPGPAHETLEDGTLVLTTLRGASGRRDVLFLNLQEMQSRGLAPGDRVEVAAVSRNGAERRIEGLTVVARDMAAGCCAAFVPETNALVPIDAHDPRSFTPSFKSIRVRITKLRQAMRRRGSGAPEPQSAEIEILRTGDRRPKMASPERYADRAPRM